MDIRELGKNLKELWRKIWNYTKKETVLVGFYLLAALFFINSIFMTLHFINRDYQFKILNNLYIEAVLPGQDIGATGRVSTGIVKIKEVKLEELELDDQIVICCDFGIDENWVEDVVGIDEENEIIESTYDGVLVVDSSVDSVYGMYVKEANFFGTIYYTSSFLRGYLFLLLSQGILLFLYHHIFVRKVLHAFKELKKNEGSEDL